MTIEGEMATARQAGRIESVPRPEISVTMTSHNRRAQTLACLEAISSQTVARYRVRVFLVDDGSTDGTSEAVAAHYPNVTVLNGDGALFWNRGMHMAQAAAMETSPDFVLWLNDDTILDTDALDRLIDCYESIAAGGADGVVVGATRDSSGCVSYGGLVSGSLVRRFRFSRLPIAKDIQAADAMNGNVVLIPASILSIIGNLDPVFEHSMGDVDYALRVRKAGLGVFVAPGSLGVCSMNPFAGAHVPGGLSMRESWRRFVGRKALPPRSWVHFVRRHGSLAWPIFAATPYVTFGLRLLLREGKKRLSLTWGAA